MRFSIFAFSILDLNFSFLGDESMEEIWSMLLRLGRYSEGMSYFLKARERRQVKRMGI